MSLTVLSLHSNVPPSQGGKYSGFGYQMAPPPRSQSQELMDGAWSSFSSVSFIPFLNKASNRFNKRNSDGK